MPKIALKYTASLPENDFRRQVDRRLHEKKASIICKEGDINPQILSRFRSLAGGIEWQALIRLIIMMDFKIVDERGNTVIGNYENRDQELADNNAKEEVE
jgi:hypothetical protein